MFIFITLIYVPSNNNGESEKRTSGDAGFFLFIERWCCRMAELQNVRHEKFAQAVATGISQRAAYRAAYPSAENWKDEVVDVKASELRKNGKVSVRIEELCKQSTSETVMTITERKEWLTGIIMDSDEKTKDRLNALDTLNKMDGVYVNNLNVNGQMDVKNPYDELSVEELQALARVCGNENT